MAAQTLDVTAAANSTNTRFGGSPEVWAGGLGNLSVQGTFGGATVRLQYRTISGGTKLNTGLSFAAAGADNFNLPEGAELWLDIAGGGGTTSITARVVQVQTNTKQQSANAG